MKTLLVTGTDTDVGKTWISCLILRELRQRGVSVGAYKPVCSGAVVGANGQRTWNDVDQLAAAIEWTGAANQICPQRFDASVAPNVAARMQNQSVDDRLLMTGIDAWKNVATHVLIEGAGGLLCPLSDDTSVAGLAQSLNAPLLIVAANRLGVINHTLLTVETAVHRGLPIAAVVLNDVAAAERSADESCSSNLEQLRRLLPKTPVCHCSHNGQSLRCDSEVMPGDLFR